MSSGPELNVAAVAVVHHGDQPPVGGISPLQYDRPKTRNPVLERHSSVAISPRGERHTPAGTPNNHDAEVAGVLWSENSVGLPLDDMARPHTSNPKYQGAMRDTPVRERITPHSSGQSPDDANASIRTQPGEGGPTAHTKAVLWASESVTIDPDLIARPRTSNPWLHRQSDNNISPSQFMESQNRGAAPNEFDSSKNQENGILWSSNENTDWHLLARPHASNPTAEKKMVASTSVQPADTSADGAPVTQVLPVNNDNVTELQNVIAKQTERITTLEHEVTVLRNRLATALGVPLSQLFPANTPPPQRSPVAETATVHPSAPAETYSTPPLQSVPKTPEQQNVLVVDDVSPVVASSEQEDSVVHSPSRNHPPAVEPSDEDVQRFVVEDKDDSNVDEFDRVIAATRSPPKNRYRPQTAGPSGAAARAQIIANALRPTSAPTRPQTADGTNSSIVDASSSMLLDNDQMMRDFHYLSCGANVLKKEDFKQFYIEKAESFGMIASGRDLDRQLRRFTAAGPNHLTFDEFAVLYLKVAAW